MRALCSLTFLALMGCSLRQTDIGENVDAGPPSTLTATGRVCTRPPDPTTGFPVKVVFLVDQSGASCVTDPPGAQASLGLCDQVPFPTSVTQPARVRALLRAVNQLSLVPNVSVALVPFDTNVRAVWPRLVGGASFGVPDATLAARINAMQSELGDFSDFQGALTAAHALIASDIALTERMDPTLLPRTSYRVVFLANGPASPRCSSSDNLGTYADDLNPSRIWADTDDSCNRVDPLTPSDITGFVGGADRNQHGQLLHLVGKLKELEAEHHVGSVRLDARLLFDEATFSACGATCDRLYGVVARWPGPVPVADVGSFAHTSARALLQSLATRGGGTFAEASTRAQLDGFTLNSLDFSSLAAENVQKALVPQVLRGTVEQGAWVLDDDGDGLSNDVESTAGTNPTLIDTDGDGFDDQFEHTHASFNPVVRDLRGCDPASPTTLGCAPRDTDGDGLSQFAEAFLQTSTTLADTDRDGLPDGLEVRWGLDPLTRLDPLADVDGDGVTDGAEVRRGSDPRVRDAAFPGVTVSVSERAPESDGRICYDFTVSQLPMLDTAARTVGPVVPAGVSLFKLWFAESPRGLAEDVGAWSAACFFARRDLSQSPPVLVPLNLSQSVPATSFVGLTQSAPARTDSCAGTEALTP